MGQPASVIEEQAVDPFLARIALERLDGRTRDAVVGAVAALVAAAVLALLALWSLAAAALCGAVAGALLACDARADRGALIDRLVRQRSAYTIEQVERRGRHLGTAEARDHAARLLGRVLAEADGLAPASPRSQVRHDRVRAAREDLLDVIFGLTDPTTSVHPSAMALLGRLLSPGAESPLYDERVPAEHLRLALRRVQLGFGRQEDAAADPLVA